jgi:hypothetical protein
MKGTRSIVRSLALVISAAFARADFDLSWYTIDSGGAMWSSGGSFVLSGTIGQPDAGAVMTGGAFALTGGFWAVSGDGAPPACIGDLNCDGIVDFGDINSFVLYLSNNAAWANTYAGCNPLNGDINCDGVYGPSAFGDINPFVSLITQCAAGCSCPGPLACP